MRRRSASGTPGPWSTTEMRSVEPVAGRVETDGVVRIRAAGVLEQVHEHLPDHRLVDVHRRQLGRAVDVDELAVECGRRVVDRPVQ